MKRVAIKSQIYWRLCIIFDNNFPSCLKFAKISTGWLSQICESAARLRIIFENMKNQFNNSLIFILKISTDAIDCASAGKLLVAARTEIKYF
jgi:hypothetical protein